MNGGYILIGSAYEDLFLDSVGMVYVIGKEIDESIGDCILYSMFEILLLAFWVLLVLSLGFLSVTPTFFSLSSDLRTLSSVGGCCRCTRRYPIDRPLSTRKAHSLSTMVPII